MNEDHLEDLKQFIEATVSQSEARLTNRINGLEQKVDDGFAGVGEAMEEMSKHVDERLINLEQQAA